MVSKPDIREELLLGKRRIGVWGAGFIGASTAMSFASEGVRVLCHDISEHKISELQKGRLGVTNLELWFGATMDEFVNKRLYYVKDAD